MSGGPTLGKYEDPLLGAGDDGLAELGSLCVAYLNLVLLFNVSSERSSALSERRMDKEKHTS